MAKEDFHNLFLRALEIAAQNVEAKLGAPISRSFMIELHAPGIPGKVLSVDDALDHIYLGADRFYRIVDVGVKGLLKDRTTAFVRVSGHPPAEFDKTWEPSKLGPFKQTLPTEIDDHRVTDR